MHAEAAIERARLQRMLFHQINKHQKSIALWKTIHCVGDEEQKRMQRIVQELELEISGMLTYATNGSLFPLGTARQEVLRMAEEYSKKE